MNVSLNFFGTAVSLELDSVEDVRYALFFYSRFIAEIEHPDVSIKLSCKASGGFFSSLLAKDSAEKQIDIRYGAHEERIEFTDWSAAASPLPPFRRICEESTVVITPGAALISPERRCVLLVGGTHAGKTAVELELLQSGWRTMADHLIVIDLGSGSVLPYLTPIGVRGEMLNAWAEVISASPHYETISEVTGKVALIDVESLVPGSAWGEAMEPTGIALLERRDDRALGADYSLCGYPSYRGNELAQFMGSLPSVRVSSSIDVWREFTDITG